MPSYSERDLRQWKALNALLAEGSGAAEGERAAARKALDGLKAKNGGPPPTDSYTWVKHPGSWSSTWSDRSRDENDIFNEAWERFKRHYGQATWADDPAAGRKYDPEAERKRRQEERDRAAARAREAEERAARARKEAEEQARRADEALRFAAVKTQRGRVEAVPGWKEIEELGELWRYDSKWPMSDNSRFDAVYRKYTETSGLTLHEVRVILQTCARIYERLGSMQTAVDNFVFLHTYDAVQLAAILRSVGQGELALGHKIYLRNKG